MRRHTFFLLIPLLLPFSSTKAQCTGDISGTALLLESDWLPVWPEWDTNYPPTDGDGDNCLFSGIFNAPICAGQEVLLFLCASNFYTISLCSSSVPFNSSITITDPSNTAAFAFDDDGCGTQAGLSTLALNPTASGLYRIRVFNDGCGVTAEACGTLIITISPTPWSSVPSGQLTNSGRISNIAPNPFTDSFELLLDRGSSATYGIVVLDQVGRSVHSGTIVLSGSEQRVTISDLRINSGSYFVQIIDQDGSLLGRERLVKL